MKICGIYKITSPNNKIYIGQSVDINDRWNKYRRYACKKQVLLYNSLKKYGWGEHRFEILCQCDRPELDNLENYYIELFDTFNARFGLNIKSGGTKGYVHSEQTKHKIGQKNKGNKYRSGRKHTEESKKKMSLSKMGNKSMSGMHHSDETRLKMSKSAMGNKNFCGHKLSDEHKRRLISSGIISNSRSVIDITTSVVYVSIKDAEKLNNMKKGSLYNMLCGKQKNKTNFRYFN